MATTVSTLNRHILEQQQKLPEFSGQLSQVLVQIAVVAKALSREIGRAALAGRVGLAGEKNPTGDSQKKLDMFTNETVIKAFAETGLVSAIASEELDEPHCLACESDVEDVEYVLCTDPLDGSSNTDTAGALGTIFGIFRRKHGPGCEAELEFLRPGSEQVAAGYVLYGSSTVLVYTAGHGVHGFTLDRDLGEFFLSHENIRCPERGQTYATNLLRYPAWDSSVRRFADYLAAGDSTTGRSYSLRYSGALVADLHRCLLEGGFYFYPADSSHPEGKLRLLYECAPLAFVVEQAGGRASSGERRILDIEVESIHQRTPLAIGSTDEVATYEQFVGRKAGGLA